jgi:putative membrane protein
MMGTLPQRCTDYGRKFMNLFALITTWLVTSISLLIISKLPTGVEISSFKKALISAIVIGLLNAFLRPILAIFTFIPNILTFGLFSVIVNAVIFALAALLVDGFALRWGIWSALIGAILLSFINSLIFNVVLS